MSKEIFELTGLDDFDPILGACITEGAEVNVPGGDKEHPAGVPGDVSIKIPAGTTITADEYNQALTSLKKSFKEGAEIMEMLEKVTVTNQSPEERQKEFNENVIADALYEAYVNGPLYEAVDDPKKDEIKKAAKAIVSKIKEETKSGNATRDNVSNLHAATWIARLIGNNPDIGRNAWKNVATFDTPKGKLNKVLASFNKEFSEILGDLVLNADCICDFDEFSKSPDTSEKDKKDFEDAAKTVGNLYIMYVDSKKSEEVKTVKVHGLKAAMSKLK